MSAIAIGDSIVVYTGPLLTGLQIYVGIYLLGMFLVALMIAGRVAVEVVGQRVEALLVALRPGTRALRARVDVELIHREARRAELRRRSVARQLRGAARS